MNIIKIEVVCCLQIKLIVLCRDISFVLHTPDISLHKNNSPESPDKDTPLAGSYKIGYDHHL